MEGIVQIVIEEGMLLGLAYLGGILTMWLPRFCRRKRLKKPVAAAFRRLREACEPETMNPADPGNPDFIRSDARDQVNLLVRRLENCGFLGPEDQCSTEPESLQRWFHHLGKVRMQL